MRLASIAVFVMSVVSGCVSLAQAETQVSTRVVSDLVFYPEFSAPGEVLSKQDSYLGAQLSAQIMAVNVEVGDQVETGDQLVQLDCAIYQAQLNTQTAALGEIDVQLSLAKDQYARAKRLNQAGNLGEEALQQRNTELEALQARRVVHEQQVKVAQISVDRCVVTAPFAGLVTERAAQLGALAAPGTPLVRLVQLTDAELSAKLPPTQNFVSGQAMKFEFLDQEFSTRVRVVLPIVDVRERTQEVRLSFTDTAPPPGAAGRLLWQSALPHLSSELLVRRQHNGESTLGVMLIEGQNARFYPVPQAIEGQSFAIDLPQDALVITEGRLGVRSGDTVSVREAGTR